MTRAAAALSRSRAVLPISDNGGGMNVNVHDAARVQAPGVSAGGSETILLTDDEALVREVTREILEHRGYTVIDARNGEEAIALSRREGPIHLMLTDLNMPVMNGRELAARMAAHRPGMRVLYTSGYTADIIRKKGLLEPGMDFIEKPFSAETLACKIREVLDAPADTARGSDRGVEGGNGERES